MVSIKRHSAESDSLALTLDGILDSHISRGGASTVSTIIGDDITEDFVVALVRGGHKRRLAVMSDRLIPPATGIISGERRAGSGGEFRCLSGWWLVQMLPWLGGLVQDCVGNPTLYKISLVWQNILGGMITPRGETVTPEEAKKNKNRDITENQFKR